MKEFFEQLYIKRIMQYVLYLFLALVTQNMLLTQVRPLGVCPLVLPAVCAAVGMFEGATWGGIFSLIMGIFADMAFVENTLLFTVLFPAIAFFSGFVSQFFINRRFFAYIGLAFVSLFFTGCLQMLGTALSDSWSITMIRTVVLQTVWALPFSVLAYLPPAKWIE